MSLFSFKYIVIDPLVLVKIVKISTIFKNSMSLSYFTISPISTNCLERFAFPVSHIATQTVLPNSLTICQNYWNTQLLYFSFEEIITSSHAASFCAGPFSLEYLSLRFYFIDFFSSLPNLSCSDLPWIIFQADIIFPYGFIYHLYADATKFISPL